MKNYYHSAVPLLAFLFSVGVAQPGRAGKNQHHEPRITPFSFIAPTSAGGGLNKKATGVGEKKVVTKIELFMWREPEWKPHWVFNIQYDGYGRIAECVNDTLMQTLFEYAADNSVIKQFDYTWDAPEKEPSSEALTEYYINKVHHYPVIPRQPFIALPYSEILPVVAPAFDSVKCYFSIWNPETRALVGTDTYIHKFEYTDDSIVQMTAGYLSSTADTIKTDWRCRYWYRFNANGFVDSVLYTEMNETGMYELTNYLKYSYSESRLTSILHEWVKNGSIQYYYDLAYTPDGQVASYIEQYTSNITTTRTNISKVVYSYGTIQVLTTGTQLHSADKQFGENRIQATLKLGYVNITVPEGTVITGAAIYDLHGRRWAAVEKLRFAGAVRLPATVATQSLLIAHISTDQGAYNLPVGIGIR